MWIGAVAAAGASCPRGAATTVPVPIETLAGLAAQMPLALVSRRPPLWADDLTLTLFLATAPARFAVASHVHLVATHRTEETEGACQPSAHPEVCDR
ncbi:MAG: hypothetical protein U0166_14430 [Acidobacteriota bacterium]